MATNRLADKGTHSAMTTKETPIVKVGDKLAIARHGWNKTHYEVYTVTKITKTGRLVTDRGSTLNPDLTVRGGGNPWVKAIPWTKELEEEDRKAAQAVRAKCSLDDVKWMYVSDSIAVKVLETYQKLKAEESKDAEESK